MDLTINTNAAQVKLAGTTGTVAAEKTNKAQETQTAFAAVDSVEQSRKYDTVELSSEAEQYLDSSAEDSTEETTDESAIQLSDYVSEDSDDIDSLYTYTDDELSDLLRDGDITQTEYNTEMAKRGISE